VAEPAAFVITVATDWDAVAAEWQRAIPACAGTLFQRFAWLDAWYRTMGQHRDIEPRLVTVRSVTDGQPVLMLPLAIVRRGGLRVLQFADQDLTDFNGPLLGPMDVARSEYQLLWRKIAAALPTCDVADFRKMPPTIAGRPNPLAAVAGATTCPVHGNVIKFSGSWDDYHRGLDRHARKELDRSWRVFQRDPTAAFVRIYDATQAATVLDIMDQQQRQRLQDIGTPFVLDHARQAAFYRHDLAGRLADNSVIIATLQTSNEVVASLYAISDGVDAVVLRISHAGKAWAAVSPGRLVVYRTLACLHAAGFASVDLSIGDYDYKRRFGVTPTRLVDLVTALSWRGQTAAAKHWAVTRMRAHPQLDGRVRQWFGQTQSPATKLIQPNT
jgi:CelD/BcsL family acetyltransferase involved in cellulose biosynthesis